MSARLSAMHVLSRVERDQAYSNLALMAEINRYEMPDPDRRLCTELVYGVLRNRSLLDFHIAHLAKRPLSRLDPAVSHTLRLALYQLLFLDRVPVHAVLSETGKLLKKIKRPHAVSFANATLRRYLRESKEGLGPQWPADAFKRLAIEQSIPDWLMDRWREELGGPEVEFKSLIGALASRAEMVNRPSPITLAPNPQRIEAQTLAAWFDQHGVDTRPGDYATQAVVTHGRGFAAAAEAMSLGLCHVMDEAAQLVGLLLDPQPGERVIDLCAAPGGKSLFIAGRITAEGRLLSVDISEGKLGLLKKQAERHGFSNIETRCADASQPIEGLEAGSFDRVLVDAPCSALGLIRRHPEIRWRRKADDIAPMAEKAYAIAMAGIRYLKPGGKLVFSVCTPTPEEGPQQLARLQRDSGMKAETHPAIHKGLWKEADDSPALPYMDTSGCPDLDGFCAFRLKSEL